MKKLAIALGILLVFSACTAPPAAIRPTPAILTLQYSPAARGWAEQASRCAAAQSDLRVVVREIPAPAVDPARADLTLRLGSPGSFHGYSAVLAQDGLAVILNPQNPLTSLSADQLYALYSGLVKNWNELPEATGMSAEAVQAWAYPAGDDLQAVFDREILRGGAPTHAYLAPDPQAMLAAVQGDRGAVGFLPQSLPAADVQTPGLTGLPDGAARFPVLSLSAVEPAGAARQILLCLQK